MPQAIEAKRATYIKLGRKGRWEGMKSATMLLVALTLSGCGTVVTSQRPDHSPGAFELRFKQQVISSTASRHDAMAEKATEVCRGAYQKIGERMDSPSEITWIIRCLNGANPH